MDTRTLRIATWNVWGLPFPVAPIPRSRRLPRVGEWLRQAPHDLVGLQELWRGAHPFLGDVTLHVDKHERGDSGLALWCPHATEGLDVVPYRAASGFDGWKQKGFLRGQIEIEEAHRFHVFVTHLQAGDGRTARAVRREQAEQLLAALEEAEGPAVVMGDFNLDTRHADDAATAARLAASRLQDAETALAIDAPTHRWTSARLDRVYFRDGDSLRWVPTEAHRPSRAEAWRFSDHLPVDVTVRLESPQSPTSTPWTTATASRSKPPVVPP